MSATSATEGRRAGSWPCGGVRFLFAHFSVRASARIVTARAAGSSHSARIRGDPGWFFQVGASGHSKRGGAEHIVDYDIFARQNVLSQLLQSSCTSSSRYPRFCFRSERWGRGEETHIPLARHHLQRGDREARGPLFDTREPFAWISHGL